MIPCGGRSAQRRRVRWIGRGVGVVEKGKPQPSERLGLSRGCRRRPTLPRPLGRSTIGAVGLNDRVRDGNECGPYALVASEVETTEEMVVFVGLRIYLIDRAIALRLISIPFREERGSSQAARAIRMG